MPRARNHTTLVRDDTEPLLAAQLLDPKRPRMGERALMLAVVEDALRCLGLAVLRDAGARARASEAREWIEADDLEWPYSFHRNICDVLGWDAAAIREALARRGWIPGRTVTCAVQVRNTLRVVTGGPIGVPPSPVSPRWQREALA